MKKSEIEDSKYIVDLKQTFFANIFWCLCVFVVVGVALLWLDQVNYFADEMNRLIYLVVGLFVVLKLLVWVGHPHLHFREKT